MNNAAFQKLVREKAGIRSSREIAREAVENEFKGKRGRNGGSGGGNYSSGDDDDDDRSNRNRPLKKKARSESDDQSKQELERLREKYRDRAQERRTAKSSAPKEGENDGGVPTKSASDIVFDDVVDALESGNRHKLALLQKQQKANEANNNKEKDIQSEWPKTADQAKAWIRKAISATRIRSQQQQQLPSVTTPVSALGQAILPVVATIYAPSSSSDTSVSTAGRTVWRTHYDFVWHPCHPGRRVWLQPVERTTTIHNNDYNNDFGDPTCDACLEKVTRCDDDLLQALKRAQERAVRRDERRQQQHNQQQQEQRAALELSKNDMDSDDDDIFRGVGKYKGGKLKSTQGIIAASETKKTASTKRVGLSIFGDSSSSVNRSTASTVQPGMDAEPVTQPTDRLMGLSSLTFGAGVYGDDGIGMDFDGRDYEDDDDKDKKIKKKTRKKDCDDEDDGDEKS